MQLSSYRDRHTPGQLRRRADRIGRRANRADGRIEAVVHIGKIRTIEDTLDHGAITKAVEDRRKAMEHASAPPSKIRDAMAWIRSLMRSEQIAARIERCTFTHLPKKVYGRRMEFAPCGGKLRKQGPRSDSWLVCTKCGRAAKPFIKAVR